MIIPNKINPIGYQKLNSFKFRLFHDGGGGGQNYIIDNNTYIIYSFGTIYLVYHIPMLFLHLMMY